MPTRPILVFYGNKGSGKTTAMRKVGVLLYDKSFNVMPLTKEQKDFDAAACNSHYLVIDNLDKKVDWLEDRLATIATGGNLKVRKLYSDYNWLDLPVKCFLTITTRNPAFGRDDVADRLLIMDLARFSDFKNESDLLAELVGMKNQIMYEVIQNIQEIIIALKENKDLKFKHRFRMADFADFATKIGKYAGIEKQIKTAFIKLAEKQVKLVEERDPMLELLFEWVEKNSDQEVTPMELCEQLISLSEESGVKFPYRGKKLSFCQKFRSFLKTWKKYFDIEFYSGGGHKKLYTFTPKKEELQEWKEWNHFEKVWFKKFWIFKNHSYFIDGNL